MREVRGWQKAAALASLTLVLGSVTAWGAAIATWDFTSLTGGANNWGASPYSGTYVPNVTVVGLARNWTITSSSSAAGAAWGGNNFAQSPNNTEAGAITGNNYVTFSFVANSGYKMSLAGIAAYNIRRSGTGPTTGIWQYQIGAGAFTDIGSAITWGAITTAAGNPQSAIDLSGISALENVAAGTVVTFRVVLWGATSTSGTWYFNDGSGSGTPHLIVTGAVLSATTYSVTYNGKGNANGTAPIDSSSPYAPGALVTVLGNTGGLVKPGYTFAGWNTAADGSGTSYSAGSTFTITANTTLYATWTFTAVANLTIFHENDVHARVTPHNWVVPSHTAIPNQQFELVGGAAYLAGKMISLVAANPDGLVLDGGDISEGNPVGDWNGSGTPIGTYGDDVTVEFFNRYNDKLRAIPGRNGRGLDAMVVGNHDIRDISYINNMKAASANFPILSINICAHGTHNPYFQAYTILNLNGHKIGIIGYTTETSDSPESAVNNLIDVVNCDWSSTDSTKIHFADYVNDLRNNQGCDIVILLTHDGHQDLCTPNSAGSTPILVDDPSKAKLPEIAITGHWHTYADTVWQPEILNYKTIFAEAGSYMHYIGELRVDGQGKYLSSVNYPLRNSAITADPDIAAYVQSSKDAFDAASVVAGDPTSDQLIGYTADNLYLDNYMKWWSADEYPWSGNNTAGNWICDAVQYKAQQLFGACDVSMESGGGVRSDIAAGPVTYSQIYETYPWADDVIWLVNMKGSEIYNYIRKHTCDVGISSGWLITAFDGNPTSITYNGMPIGMNTTYKVAINNYMYLHDTVPFSDPNPQTSTYLARTALVDFTSQFTQNNPYHAGDSRYVLNGEFSGAYTAVVTMMNDRDSKEYFDYAFLRLLYATNETMVHYNTKQVPNSLVNLDGTINQGNRLAETELYRSYLGFRTNALMPGDIIVTYGKSGFYGGNPEFVDQEGIYGDGQEFVVVGHDETLSKPNFVPSINTALDDFHKNHYVQFLARRTGTSSVVDQQNTALAVMDATAYNAMTLPGNNGDLLLLTGVPTSENFSMRFRCASAVEASTAGFTDYPPTSQIDAVASFTQSAPTLHLTAQAANLVPTSASVGSSEDSSVSSANKNTTSPTSTQLFVESAKTGFGDERTWVKFDLSSFSLPSGATLNQVLLKLWCFQADTVNDLPVDIWGFTDDTLWSETTLTWNDQPDPATEGTLLGNQTLLQGNVNLYYTFDVTSFVTGEMSGDKKVSLMITPTTESSSTTIAYRFDSRDYQNGINTPLLEFDYSSPAGAPGAGIANVAFQYRYSADNMNWSSWTTFATGTAAPYVADFTYPNGFGYYQFQSIATGVNGMTEPAPLFADTAVLFICTPPSFTSCPSAPIFANTAAGACTAVVNYTAAASGFPSPTLSYAFAGVTSATGSGTGSGSTFNKGTTHVTVTAQNGCSPDASCEFDVTVDDAEGPTINCPGNITQNTDPGVCTAKVSWPTLTASDNCDGTVPVVCTPASGSTFPKGTTHVTCKATDAAQNRSSCGFDVTVNDTEAPALTCPANVEYSTSGACAAVYLDKTSLGMPTVDDNCGGSGAVVVVPTRSDKRDVYNDPYPVGVTTITWTTTDESGNTTTCNQKVTVTNDKTIAANFNGTAIPAGDTIWFNAVLKPKLPKNAGSVTIRFFNQSITSSKFSLSLPNATVTFTTNVTCASTTFGPDGWTTTAPSDLAGSTFLAAFPYQVPSGGLPGGLKSVTWSGTFTSVTSGVTLQWQWGAAVYTTFGASPGVKSTDDTKGDCMYHNSDQAGTPENYKSNVVGGAMGGGGSNWTGGLSSTEAVVPCQNSRR